MVVGVESSSLNAGNIVLYNTAGLGFRELGVRS
jgi:hypothetical protein